MNMTTVARRKCLDAQLVEVVAMSWTPPALLSHATVTGKSNHELMICSLRKDFRIYPGLLQQACQGSCCLTLDELGTSSWVLARSFFLGGAQGKGDCK